MLLERTGSLISWAMVDRAMTSLVSSSKTGRFEIFILIIFHGYYFIEVLIIRSIRLLVQDLDW